MMWDALFESTCRGGTANLSNLPLIRLRRPSYSFPLHKSELWEDSLKKLEHLAVFWVQNEKDGNRPKMVIARI